MKKILSICFILTFVFCFSGCKKKEKPDNSNLTEFEQSLTAQDSAEVRKLVDDYFKLVMAGRYYDAASMLYNPSKDSKNGEPKALENEQLQRVVALLNSIPVVDYKIEYMKFEEEVHNEVLCDVIMVKATKNSKELTTKFAFCPLKYMGYWVLCVDDFEAGTTGISRSTLRDSLRRVYEEAKLDSLSKK